MIPFAPWNHGMAHGRSLSAIPGMAHGPLSANPIRVSTAGPIRVSTTSHHGIMAWPAYHSHLRGARPAASRDCRVVTGDKDTPHGQGSWRRGP